MSADPAINPPALPGPVVEYAVSEHLPKVDEDGKEVFVMSVVTAQAKIIAVMGLHIKVPEQRVFIVHPDNEPRFIAELRRTGSTPLRILPVSERQDGDK